MLHILLYILLMIVSLVAVALNILSLPGNWLMLLVTVIVISCTGWSKVAIIVIAAMLCILLLGEAIELLGSLVGAKKFGASTGAAWAAIGGALAGGLLGFLIPIPVIGNLIGAVVGAFLAAWIVELILEKPLKAATWAAVGAALGRAMGMFAKIACGLAAWIVLLFFACTR